jgi:hypothetical protein
MDWQEVLDFDLAVVNCHYDMIGDWYRDPWGWPELDWAAAERPDIIVARLNGRGVQRSAKLDVPKENFATRPAMVMDPVDRLIYQALVDRVSVQVIGDMRPWVYGWRLSRRTPKSGRYATNSDEWEWYRTRLSRLAGRFRFGLTTDIVSFFASIPVDRLCDEITARAGGAPVSRLVDMLQAWARMQGRPGLPQRSMASAALANMYLRPLDDIVESVATKSKSLAFPAATRWMDDIWLFGRDDGVLRRSQLAIEATVRDLGLNMSAAKTHVLHGDELMVAAREVEHSAVDEGLAEDPPDAAALESLLDRLLGKPEEAPRTSIKFATTRIRGHNLWDLVQRFADAANRMPHGADSLGRLFRDANAWRDLEEWYVDYAESPWGVLDWSVAQLGTMFPTPDEGSGHVAEYLASSIDKRPPLPLLALASQRVASWRPDEARQVIREAAKRADHPLERRVLALAALSAKEERQFVRSLLREFEQNDATLAFLEARNFRPLPIKGDFG